MSATRILVLPRDILDSPRLSADDVHLELAVALYAQQRLTIGKARELAGRSLWKFQQKLTFRRVPPHYGADDLPDDVSALRYLGQV